MVFSVSCLRFGREAYWRQTINWLSFFYGSVSDYNSSLSFLFRGVVMASRMSCDRISFCHVDGRRFFLVRAQSCLRDKEFPKRQDPVAQELAWTGPGLLFLLRDRRSSANMVRAFSLSLEKGAGGKVVRLLPPASKNFGLKGVFHSLNF